MCLQMCHSKPYILWIVNIQFFDKNIRKISYLGLEVLDINRMKKIWIQDLCTRLVMDKYFSGNSILNSNVIVH